MSKRIDSPISYRTEYRAKDGRQYHYTTKTLTPAHERLREKYPDAMTLKCDRSVKWAFGVYSEVLFKSKDQLEAEARRAARKARQEKK